MAIPFAIIFIVIQFLVDNPPKYIYNKNKIECVVMLNKIAKFNGKEDININQLQDVCKFNLKNKDLNFRIISH